MKHKRGGRRYEDSVFCRWCTKWIYKEDLNLETHFNKPGGPRHHNECNYQISMNNRHRNQLQIKRY